MTSRPTPPSSGWLRKHALVFLPVLAFLLAAALVILGKGASGLANALFGPSAPWRSQGAAGSAVARRQSAPPNAVMRSSDGPRGWRPDLRGASRFLRLVLLVSLACNVASIVFLAGPWDSLHTLYGGLDPAGVGLIFACSGMACGAILVIESSRSFFGRTAGIVVCALLALMFAALNGWTLYLASTGIAFPVTSAFAAGTAPAFPVTPGFAGLLIHQTHPALASMALAALGVLACGVLVISPWSRHRSVVQPAAVIAAVVFPLVSMMLIPGFRTHGGSFIMNGSGAMFGPAYYAGGIFLVLGALAGLLAGPVRLASSIEWVKAVVRPASRAAQWMSRRRWRTVALLAVQGAWLTAGYAGVLPHSLGGNLDAWQVMHTTPVSRWVVAAVLVVAALLWARGYVDRLQAEDAAAAEYLLTPVLYLADLGLAMFIMLEFGVFSFVGGGRAILVMGVAISLLGVVLGRLSTTRRQHTIPRITAYLVTAAALGVCAGLVWPRARHYLTNIDLFQAFHINLLSSIDNSALALAVTGLLSAFLAWRLWLFIKALRPESPAVGIDESDYLAVVEPFAIWMLVTALLELFPALLEISRSRPQSPYLPTMSLYLPTISNVSIPDPVVLDAVLVAVAAVAFLTGALRNLGAAYGQFFHVLLLATPVLAFVPFLIPAQVRTGRLVIVALVAPLAWQATVGARDLNREPGRLGRICWFAGITTLTVPLLAYSALVGHKSLDITALLSDTGGVTGGVGPTTHLRLLLLAPLLLSLAVANGKDEEKEFRTAPRSRLEDLTVVRLFDLVPGGGLKEAYEPLLSPKLNELTHSQLCAYAARIARRMLSFYCADPALAWPVQAELGDLLDKAADEPDSSDSEKIRNYVSLLSEPQFNPPPRLLEDDSERYTVHAVRAVRAAIEQRLTTSIQPSVDISMIEIEDAFRRADGPLHTKPTRSIEAQSRDQIRQQLRSLPGFNAVECIARLALSASGSRQPKRATE